MTIRATITTLAALLLAAVAVGCGEKTKTTRLTLIATQASPNTVQTEEAPPGPSPGEARAFGIPLETESGRPAGRLDGTVFITDRARRGAEVREYRVGTVVLTLQGGSIVASGMYVSTPTEALPAPEGARRPIVGGTGKYRGARGELFQTPLPGDRFKNVLVIETPGL